MTGYLTLDPMAVAHSFGLSYDDRVIMRAKQ